MKAARGAALTLGSKLTRRQRSGGSGSPAGRDLWVRKDTGRTRTRNSSVAVAETPSFSAAKRPAGAVRFREQARGVRGGRPLRTATPGEDCASEGPPAELRGCGSLLGAAPLTVDSEPKTRPRGRNELILLGPFCSQQGGGAGAVLGDAGGWRPALEGPGRFRDSEATPGGRTRPCPLSRPAGPRQRPVRGHVRV